MTQRYKRTAQAAISFPLAQLVRLRRWACCILRPQIYRSDASLALAAAGLAALRYFTDILLTITCDFDEFVA